MKKIFTTTVGFAVMVSSQSVFADPDRISELREEVLLLERLVELKRELAALEKAETTTSLQSASKSQYTPSQDQLDLKVVAQEIDTPVLQPEISEEDQTRVGSYYSPKGKKTGLYAGGNVGLGFVDFHFSAENTNSTTADIALLAGETYGILGGYSDTMSNGLFYAVEAEYNESNINLSGSTSNNNGELKIDLDNWKALSVRLGKSFDNSPLVGYMKTGYAKGDFTLKYTDEASSANNIDSSNDRSGWLYGAGFEHPLSKNMILRGEYLVIDLDEWSETSGSGTAKLDPDVHVAKIGIDVPF